MIGLKKTNIEKIQMIWKQTDKSNVLKKPNFSRTLETIKPAEISPKGEQDAMMPIVDSEKPSYFWRITITVIKYPRTKPVKKATTDKYFILGFIDSKLKKFFIELII